MSTKALLNSYNLKQVVTVASIRLLQEIAATWEVCNKYNTLN